MLFWLGHDGGQQGRGGHTGGLRPMHNQQHRFVAPTEHRRIPDRTFLDTVLADDDGMASCMAACGCPASFPAHCFVQNEEPAEMADWYFSIVDAWCVLPPRITEVFDLAEQQGWDDAVLTAARKAVESDDTGSFSPAMFRF